MTQLFRKTTEMPQIPLYGEVISPIEELKVDPAHARAMLNNFCFNPLASRARGELEQAQPMMFYDKNKSEDEFEAEILDAAKVLWDEDFNSSDSSHIVYKLYTLNAEFVRMQKHEDATALAKREARMRGVLEFFERRSARRRP